MLISLLAAWALAAGPSDTVAIADVSVLPMTSPRVLAHQTILIADGRIVALGDATTIAVPRTARRIDGRGKFVVPGLADMHVHLSVRGEFPLFVGAGVLTVRDLNGSPEKLGWRDSVAAGRMFGPRLIVSGPMIAGAGIPWSNKAVPRTPAEADSVVVAQKRAGYDQIKIYDGLSVDVFNAAMAAAKRVGMSVRNFVRRFKQATGDSPLIYLQKLRVAAAKNFGNGHTLSIYLKYIHRQHGLSRYMFQGLPHHHFRIRVHIAGHLHFHRIISAVAGVFRDRE